jgi:hypothetical protein
MKKELMVISMKVVTPHSNCVWFSLTIDILRTIFYCLYYYLEFIKGLKSNLDLNKNDP